MAQSVSYSASEEMKLEAEQEAEIDGVDPWKAAMQVNTATLFVIDWTVLSWEYCVWDDGLQQVFDRVVVYKVSVVMHNGSLGPCARPTAIKLHSKAGANVLNKIT